MSGPPRPPMTIPSIYVYLRSWVVVFKLCQLLLSNHSGIGCSVLYSCSREGWPWLQQRITHIERITVYSPLQWFLERETYSLTRSYSHLGKTTLISLNYNCLAQKCDCWNGAICSMHHNVMVTPCQMKTACLLFWGIFMLLMTSLPNCVQPEEGVGSLTLFTAAPNLWTRLDQEAQLTRDGLNLSLFPMLLLQEVGFTITAGSASIKINLILPFTCP